MKGSVWEAELAALAGDIVQAIQGLKEARPQPTGDLWNSLTQLLSSLTQFQLHTENSDTGPLCNPLSRPEAQVRDALYVFFPEKARVLDSAPSLSPDSRISVDIPSQSKLETFQLGPYQFPRLLNGLWQLASPAWGSESSEKQIDALGKLIQSGFVATDMADHYVGFTTPLPSCEHVCSYSCTTNHRHTISCIGRCGTGLRKLPQSPSP